MGEVSSFPLRTIFILFFTGLLLFCTYVIMTEPSLIFVTEPAKIDHVSTKKSPIFSVFAVS